MSEIIPRCECRRFICEPIQEFVNGENRDSNIRIRLHKNESGRIDHTQIIESNIVDCEIKEAGQHAAITRHMGELSIKNITKEFMEARGQHYED